MQVRSRFQVRSFGRDCLGNVSGYCVVDTSRISQLNDGVIDRFVAEARAPGEVVAESATHPRDGSPPVPKTCPFTSK